MSKSEDAIAALTAQLTELSKIAQSKSMTSGFDFLGRWKERAIRVVGEVVNENEARKFSEKKIGLMNAIPSVNWRRNLQAQQSFLESLIHDIKQHPDEYFGDSPIPFVPGSTPSPTFENAFKLIHPAIIKVSKQKFIDGHFADSVETALKAVNTRVKEYYLSKRGKELDGSNLMHQTFSPGNPVIILDDMSTESGKSIQQGYMEIFAGSMTAIRNPKAHGIVNISAERALHFLFLASLEMGKLDDAKVP